MDRGEGSECELRASTTLSRLHTIHNLLSAHEPQSVTNDPYELDQCEGRDL